MDDLGNQKIEGWRRKKGGARAQPYIRESSSLGFVSVGHQRTRGICPDTTEYVVIFVRIPANARDELQPLIVAALATALPNQ